MARWLAARVPGAPPDLEARVFVAFAAARGIVMMSMVMPERAPDDEALVQALVRGSLAYLRD